MRQPRLKPTDTDTFMHVYNRIAGSSHDLLFVDADKEYFIQRLISLTSFYVIDVLGFAVLGNHFHAILHIPATPPTNAEAAKRYSRFHGGTCNIEHDQRRCRALAKKLRDVSEFMHDLQQPFSRWWNKTRPVRRRGHLWGDRFKNTVLESGVAVWNCLNYIEANPVRAHMVDDPGQYRFCSFGRWTGTGTHPFEDAVEAHLLPTLKGSLGLETMTDLRREMRKRFAWITALEQQHRSPQQAETAMAVAAEKEHFSLRIDRRVRYWVDGLVIGSQIFIKTTMAESRGEAALKKRRLVRARGPDADRHPLFSFKQLRVLLV